MHQRHTVIGAQPRGPGTSSVPSGTRTTLEARASQRPRNKKGSWRVATRDKKKRSGSTSVAPSLLRGLIDTAGPPWDGRDEDEGKLAEG